MGHTSVVLYRQFLRHLMDVPEEGFFLKNILSFTLCPHNGLSCTRQALGKLQSLLVQTLLRLGTLNCSLISACTFDSFCPFSRVMAVYFVVKPLAVSISSLHYRELSKICDTCFPSLFIHLLHCFPPNRGKFGLD